MGNQRPFFFVAQGYVATYFPLPFMYLHGKNKVVLQKVLQAATIGKANNNDRLHPFDVVDEVQTVWCTF